MSVSILDARAKCAAVLAPIAADDPRVYDTQPDAIVPPCIMLGWRIPMIEWQTQQTACMAYGHVGLTLVGSRLEVAVGMQEIEKMYDFAQRRLRADSEGWSLREDTGMAALEVGNVLYLACRVDVRVPLLL